MAGTGATHLEQADCDVLVVGAGPTGLVLAAQLLRFGATVRVVDAAESAVKESRALVIQARTLEVLRPFGVSDELVRRGNPAARLGVHAGSRVADIPLFDIGADDTAYPFLLFLSQAQTEAVLEEHLASAGGRVERGTRVEGVRDDGDTAVCVLRRPDGTTTEARARWVVGCDGFTSAVRQSTGIDFVGGRYPQTFLLADLDADGLQEGLVHGFLTGDGPLLFFPLRRPAAWRLVVVRPGPEALDPSPVTLSELQALADDATGGTVTLRQPVWATRFRVHHRQATTYRRGRVLLAGDAAHVHSPAGGQGMNTGIQDAVNLGWKLALVARGVAAADLLDTYDAERRPVGAFVLRFTDRAFRVVTSPNPVLRAVRAHLAPRVLPVALRVRAARAVAFRTVSQLGIRYADGTPGRRLVRRRPAAVGDRLPDAPLSVGDATTSLHEVTAPPTYHLLLLDTGSSDAWDRNRLADLGRRYAQVLTVHRIVLWPPAGPPPGAPPLPDSPPLPDRPLHDDTGLVRSRLAASPGTGVLVRPDGHIGCRVEHHRLDAASEHLARWLPGR